MKFFKDIVEQQSSNELNHYGLLELNAKIVTILHNTNDYM
jgi:hypothetical protein